MRTPVYTRQFEKDVKLCKKRGKDFEKFKRVMSLLLTGARLPVRCHDHALTGNLSGFRDCHLEPDWLLIYSQSETEVCFQRMGSHADLF